MEIVQNSLLTPTNKYIKFYETALISTDGPYVSGKLNLVDLNIPYDSAFSSTMTLKSKDRDWPISYGFLGKNVTFVAIRVNYPSHARPGSNADWEKYIEYWFEDDPMARRCIGQFMILTGIKSIECGEYGYDHYNQWDDRVEGYALGEGGYRGYTGCEGDYRGYRGYPECEGHGRCPNWEPTCQEHYPEMCPRPVPNSCRNSHRIPQMYLYNPTDFDVRVEIMVANIDPNDFDFNDKYDTVSTLYFNSVITDQIYGMSTTGSTQFQILDYNGNIKMTIPFASIRVVNKRGAELVLTAKDNKNIKLIFLSEWNCYQAYSRMSWVIESTTTRYLTKAFPGVDNAGPVITFNSLGNPTYLPLGNGIDKNDIRFRFLNNIWDYDSVGSVRDGNISIYDTDVTIMEIGSLAQLSSITYSGDYTIMFMIKDIAGNTTSQVRELLVDSTSPVINYTTGFTTNIMDLTGNTSTPGTITRDDLNRYYILYVWDDIDGIIANSAVTITINSNSGITGITDIGYYTINFSVSDRCMNTTTGTTTLRVVDSYYPVFVYNSGFTGSTFYLSLSDFGTYLSANTYITTTVSAVTNYFEGNIPLSNVSVSVVGGPQPTFPLVTTGTYTLMYSVYNYSGHITNDTKTMILST
jgi:hypothetical protein